MISLKDYSGVINLSTDNYIKLNDTPEQAGRPKAVIGPGTGLGEGFLVKSEHSPFYEVCPAEGGHCEYAPRNEEEYALAEFAKKYIAESDNVENLRAKTKINRLSVERVGAGPAVPLIYAFYAERHPELEKVLENEGIAFNDITSKDIIRTAMERKDPLCMKVVQKFTEIFAVETANLALKTLPFGGIYLIGGVTHGIMDYILTTDTFTKNFFEKGRLEEVLRKVPLYLVREDTNVGLLGAEEFAYRLYNKEQQKQ